jgi:hypothetical protein
MSSRTTSWLLIIVGSLNTAIASGQAAAQSRDTLWTRLSVTGRNHEPDVGASSSGLFSDFALSQDRIGRILKAAPHEFTQKARTATVVISIPLPDGSFQRFRIEESPVIKKALESAGSETHTYKGIGLDDPTATIRFETAFDGFHAMVRSAAGVFYIDPTSRHASPDGQRAYRSYFSGARRSPPRRLHCEVSGERADQDRLRNSAKPRPAPHHTLPRATENVSSTLRVYRLALAANSYYVDAVYDETFPTSRFDQAAAAIQRTVNRITSIYESDHGIRLILVDDEAKLIYTTAASDPYHAVNSDANAALAVNQKNVDEVIGSANYDIGHLLSTDTAGLASVGSVCNATYKAQGVTGIATPSGDPFDVDYVSHEFGHQFGANHTFNTVSGSCNGNRFSNTAYEPGSGSTIMGYAGPGICDPSSLQDHSDAYFHIASLLEIQDYVSDTSPGSGGSCAITKELPFAPPSLSPLLAYTIPKGTPFVLAANPTDIQPNKYIFTWEEFDLGDPSPPDDENGRNATARPLFRSRQSGSAGVRFFPALAKLLGTPGSSDLGEALPMLDQTMKFRLTARNNHGSFAYSEAHVTVDGHSGPFGITSTSDGKTWQRGSVHNLRWDVAHTDEAPVSCPYLRLELAIEEDPSKAFTLAEGVPNSGSFDFTIPEGIPITSRARLMLKSANNIFLAVSPFVVEITPK